MAKISYHIPKAGFLAAASRTADKLSNDKLYEDYANDLRSAKNVDGSPMYTEDELEEEVNKLRKYNEAQGPGDIDTGYERVEEPRITGFNPPKISSNKPKKTGVVKPFDIGALPKFSKEKNLLAGINDGPGKSNDLLSFDWDNEEENEDDLNGGLGPEMPFSKDENDNNIPDVLEDTNKRDENIQTEDEIKATAEAAIQRKKNVPPATETTTTTPPATPPPTATETTIPPATETTTPLALETDGADNGETDGADNGDIGTGDIGATNDNGKQKKKETVNRSKSKPTWYKRELKANKRDARGLFLSTLVRGIGNTIGAGARAVGNIGAAVDSGPSIYSNNGAGRATSAISSGLGEMLAKAFESMGETAGTGIEGAHYSKAEAQRKLAQHEELNAIQEAMLQKMRQFIEQAKEQGMDINRAGVYDVLRNIANTSGINALTAMRSDERLRVPSVQRRIQAK
jgi:hypothetical protein